MSAVIKTAGLRFICDDTLELWRAKTLLSKEKGTVAWIQREVKAGDVFYDIGASTGIYALLAALQVGPEGAVYAFEPNLLSAMHLLRNAQANQMLDRVHVITSALHDEDTFLPFHYPALRPGVSGSQLGEAIDEMGTVFVPEFTELKHATTIDGLLDMRHIRSATLVKIDVDGNESRVLRGMRALLRAPLGPRSVQVEMHPATADALIRQMGDYGFVEKERHHTSFGEEAIANGVDPAKVFYNMIFGRA